MNEGKGYYPFDAQMPAANARVNNEPVRPVNESSLMPEINEYFSNHYDF